MTVSKKSFDLTVSRQTKKVEADEGAKRSFLEFLFTVLFFVALVVTLAAFLFLSPFVKMPALY